MEITTGSWILVVHCSCSPHCARIGLWDGEEINGGATLPIGAASALEGGTAHPASGGAPCRLKVAARELHDIAADPAEQKNLTDAHGGRCGKGGPHGLRAVFLGAMLRRLISP